MGDNKWAYATKEQVEAICAEFGIGTKHIEFAKRLSKLEQAEGKRRRLTVTLADAGPGWRRKDAQGNWRGNRRYAPNPQREALRQRLMDEFGPELSVRIHASFSALQTSAGTVTRFDDNGNPIGVYTI